MPGSVRMKRGSSGFGSIFCRRSGWRTASIAAAARNLGGSLYRGAGLVTIAFVADSGGGGTAL